MYQCKIHTVQYLLLRKMDFIELYKIESLNFLIKIRSATKHHKKSTYYPILQSSYI